jgi:ubiquinone biosynthesis protein COQ4
MFRLLPKLSTYALNPFRLSAAQAMSEFVCAVAAPRFQAEFEMFAASAAGRERLQKHSDLTALLDDHESLDQLPEGSLGREYVAFVRGAYMGDVGADGTMTEAASFLDLLGIDEAAQRMGWPGEIVWYLRRMVLTHDLTHVFTGYGTDNAGEFANIAYTVGHFRIHALFPIVLISMLVVKPERGRRAWCRYLWAAYRRGRSQREDLSQLDYETLLTLPLPEVLRRIGIDPFDDTHPDGRIADELGFANLNKQAILDA